MGGFNDRFSVNYLEGSGIDFGLGFYSKLSPSNYNL